MIYYRNDYRGTLEEFNSLKHIDKKVKLSRTENMILDYFKQEMQSLTHKMFKPAEDQYDINEYIRKQINEKYEKEVVQEHAQKEICLNCKHAKLHYYKRIYVKEMKDYEKMLEQLTNNSRELSPGESDFIESLNTNGLYTDKQKAWLEDIHDRVFG